MEDTEGGASPLSLHVRPHHRILTLSFGAAAGAPQSAAGDGTASKNLSLSMGGGYGVVVGCVRAALWRLLVSGRCAGGV